jgi:hypothetical protein
MGRIYTVQFNGVAVTAQQDLFEITAAAGKPCRILSINLSQSSEVGDAQEEQLLILVKSGQTTSGSGGTAPTPVTANPSDAAAGFSAEVNNTTKASTGTIVTHLPDAWNVRMPLWKYPPEKAAIELSGGRRMTVELASTPADSITMNGYMEIEEEG